MMLIKERQRQMIQLASNLLSYYLKSYNLSALW